MAITAAALLTALVLVVILVRPSRVVYIKLASVPAICAAFILGLVLLSDTAVQAAVNGLKLWAGIVVPSLLPFFVAAEVLNSTGFIRVSGILLEPVMRPFFNVPGCGSFALAMGVTSGYPVGAKIVCDFRSRGDLTRTEAERLLAFTNNSGPLFIIGAVGTGMYGSPRLGLLLLACHFCACITVGFLFRFYKAGGKESMGGKENGKPPAARLFKEIRAMARDGTSFKGTNLGTIIGESVKNSVNTILAIGGFILLFSVIISFLTETGVIGGAAKLLSPLLSPLGLEKDITAGVLSGFFEITTGSSLISKAPSIPAALKLPAASLVIGWAGLSVHFQVLSIASKTDVSMRPYLLGKLLQGIIAAFYTWICLRIFGLEMIIKEPVLGGSLFTPAAWLKMLGSSVLTLTVLLCVFALLALAGRYRTGRKPARTRRR
jgi:sporulation integral membrane protein YlbJ